MSDNKITKKSYINTETGKKIFYRISVLFLFVYIVLPQYFGLNTPGFDLTAQRMMFLFVLLYIIESPKRAYEFWEMIKSSELLPYIAVYLFICFYTAIYRHHIGTFLYSLIELLTMFEVIFIVKNVVGLEKTFKYLRLFTYLLCILGIIEFLMKKTPFSYLETIKGLYTGGMIRSGSYRVMGPANHSLGYGLMLVILLPISCLDIKKDEINILKHVPLFLLIVVNVFLTGSRSTLAVMMLEIVLLFVFSNRNNKKRTFFYFFFFIAIMAILVVLLYNTGFSRYILLQITSVIDEIFDTQFSLNYGADVTTLYNSSNYRTYLPRIFSVDFLSPWIGRGSGYRFTWYVEGVLVASIDNFYVATYIRYAYSGLIAYVAFIIKIISTIVKNLVIRKSGFCSMVFIGVVCYFINLWWLDTLQTIKYVYFLIALFYVYISNGHSCESVSSS